MINTIVVSNVLVFRNSCKTLISDMTFREPMLLRVAPGAFHLDFCDGINVLIGENGVGKSSLLKMIYAAAQWSKDSTSRSGPRRLVRYFSNYLDDERGLHNALDPDGLSAFQVFFGEKAFEYVPDNGLESLSIWRSVGWDGLNLSTVMIPATEMLTHAKGFLAMNEKYKMPFDQTQIDIIVNASLPETKEITPNMQNVLEKLSDVIDGTVVQSDDVFYVLKKDGRKVDFSLEAEGYRKLGLLWKLVRSGLLESGSILLWDEPEANLNPGLYALVAEVLLELQKGGVQIFVATHSYNFAKYLEIRRTVPEQVLFHNLYRVSSGLSENSDNPMKQGDMIAGASASTMDELPENHIMMADENLLNEVYHLRGGL